MAEPEPSPAGPSPLDAFTRRLRLSSDLWGRRVTLVLMLLVVSVAAGFVISPGLYSQQIPALAEEHLGKPFRANSPAGFKAARDYEISHSAMTEQRRQEARGSVRPVYDLNPGVGADVRSAVKSAFADLRARLAAKAAEESAQAGEEPELRREAGKPARKTPTLTPQEAERQRKERETLQADFQEQLFGQRDAAMEMEDFQALLTNGFSEEAEVATLSLLERAYGSERGPLFIGGSREELSREGPQGITVRDVRHSGEQTLPGTAPGVLDVREAHSELDRFASIPGNLLPDAPGAQRRAVLRLAKRLVRPNLTINIAETNARRLRASDAVKDAVISMKKGQRVIGDGELVNETHLVILKGMRAQTDRLDLLQLQVGGTGLVALLIAASFVFCRTAFRRFRPTRKDGMLLGLLLVGVLGLLQLWVSIADAIQDRYTALPLEALYYAFPMAAGAMLVRFLLSEELSLFFALVLACLAGVMLGNSLSFGIYTLVGSLVAADRITRARDRVGIFKAGLITGMVELVAVLCLFLVEGKGLTTETVLTALFASVGTALAVPVMVMALTPLLESVFGYASDIKLLELANLNHPALKELIVQAPGTYHHSIIIGSLVENAAEAIGANPLLARSCAYYHDIGKGRNPLFFGENQKGENRHDSLAPAMSAVIIKRHVTEGLEMARQYRLPKLVADAIPQHHGTRLVGYFFHKAVKEQEGKENAQPLDESIYRYPGPKPQFREAALVMIADAVEASTRAMPEPTKAKLHAQVQKMINIIFSEGQLDECDLTLKDLNLISDSFLHTLEGIYHARPEYPAGAMGGGPKTAPLMVASTVKPDGKSDGKARSA
ncbi:HD family phosphohydrolase [Stigmatella aurantiaca]|uniref:Metal-dependent phosphohydrolase n=1 Tax=Stigmatella aurantiaca (strain DW4/3-1) TaxID=378806 RepID=E3FSQ6_STIAD|nr:HDIG domain-containing metalloprotein [Stigmatella aurantiaca]ADO73352.1 Metal-dependent phosphohydrolase [Stigmatella aurantiaca DW4/3-1]